MKTVGHYSGFTESQGFGFTSGIIGTDTDGRVVHGIFEQTKAALQILTNILTERNLDLQSVVKTTVYIINNDDFIEMNRAYEKAFGESKPARSTVIVAALPQVESDGPEKILFEIDAIVATQ